MNFLHLGRLLGQLLHLELDLLGYGPVVALEVPRFGQDLVAHFELLFALLYIVLGVKVAVQVSDDLSGVHFLSQGFAPGTHVRRGDTLAQSIYEGGQNLLGDRIYKRVDFKHQKYYS